MNGYPRKISHWHCSPGQCEKLTLWLKQEAAKEPGPGSRFRYPTLLKQKTRTSTDLGILTSHTSVLDKGITTAEVNFREKTAEFSPGACAEHFLASFL